jgi:hypothetical protein
VVTAPQVEIAGKQYGKGFPLDLDEATAKALIDDGKVRKAAAKSSKPAKPAP